MPGVGRPTTYTRAAGLAIARLLAEGGSLRAACTLIPRAIVQLVRWSQLPDGEFRRLRILAERARKGDAEALEALYAPPARRAELLDPLLAEIG